MTDPVASPMPPPNPPRPATRRFVVLVAVATALVTAAVVIGALAEFSYWRENQPDMTGLTTKVMDSMNQSLSTDRDFAKMGLHVKSISVMRAAGDMFEGQATVATTREVDHQVTVHILYDGDTLLWHTDPGSFAFVAQEQFSD